jgi:xanthine dehydrogenase small subunit
MDRQTPMRHDIRFLLGDELQKITAIDPTLTVLDWLRGNHRQGTKEGCNEGDCGACTIVIGRLEDGAIRYRAVNSCIQFVASLDGCQVLTVENLRRNGSLHAVQQAMIDCHASQCGFCTPGFVMSLFAMTKEFAASPSDDTIDDVLAGNLCRCTGYAPIVRAARRAYHLGVADSPVGQSTLQSRLQGLNDGQSYCLTHGQRKFFAPSDLQTLAEVLAAHPNATIIAGATDVGLWVTKQMRRPDSIVWTGHVKELLDFNETEDAFEIGAAVTYAKAAARLAGNFPDLGEILRRLGSVQIRNVATIGGNIANGSPIGDSAPALIAAAAVLHLRQGRATRSMPLENFFRAYGQQDRMPGEFIEKITLPKAGAGSNYRAYKVSKRFDQDISAVMGAFHLRMAGSDILDARIAFGGMAATPKRAMQTETVLRGKHWNERTLADAQAALENDFAPISDMRASAHYRLSVAKNLLRRLLFETNAPAIETRLVGIRSRSYVQG